MTTSFTNTSQMHGQRSKGTLCVDHCGQWHEGRKMSRCRDEIEKEQTDEVARSSREEQSRRQNALLPALSQSELCSDSNELRLHRPQKFRENILLRCSLKICGIPAHSIPTTLLWNFLNG
ncbi:hypothetical protein F2P81_023530 [Scophthalmus maximus]|uniref:Uncharacterized protein n=1 Tax=Scophthalmus maximus TaxID=52904 RepID=A0A6A4RXS4_SCOMX|nr:hypothetical protein F2P81_023530 [Scophthalmus maximus]